MRRYVVSMLAVGLVAGALAAPAAAGGKKEKVDESFTAQALPFPNLSSATGTEQRGCFAGEEGVHKASQPFESPGKGVLEATLEGFTGDWDLGIFDEDGTMLVGSLEDQTGGAPAEETVALPLKRGDKVLITACNWVGEPEVEVHYGGVFRK